MVKKVSLNGSWKEIGLQFEGRAKKLARPYLKE
jgi:hypothetical protein